MEIFKTDVAVARAGAAFPGARSPWASLSLAGADHARPQNRAMGAGIQDARRTAFRTVPVMTRQLAVVAAEPLAANGTRKQNVHKTRINAGGYGAMGPHPEREPA